MNNAQRALMIARRAAGGRSPMQSGGTDTPDQQPQASPQQSNAYITSMTAPMGSNVGAYAAQSGYNAANQLQQADWSGNLNKDQAGAIGGGSGPGGGGMPPPGAGGAPPSSGGGGGPMAGAPMPPGGVPPSAQPQQPARPGTTAIGSVAPQISTALQNALQLRQADQEQKQPAQPTQGAQPVINAGGKNTVTQPGQVDEQGNEKESPSARRVQDAMKNTADVSGITDKIRQQKIQNVINSDPVGNLFRKLLSGQQQPSGAQPQQPQPVVPGTGQATPAQFSPQVTPVGARPLAPGTQPQPQAAVPQQPAAPPAAEPPAIEPPGVQRARQLIESTKNMTVGQLLEQYPQAIKQVRAMYPQQTQGYSDQQILNYIKGMPEGQAKVDWSRSEYNPYLPYTGVTSKDLQTALQGPAQQQPPAAGTQSAQAQAKTPNGLQLPWGNVPYRVGSKLGEGRNHQGYDVLIPHGTPLKPPSDGVITGWNPLGAKQANQGPGAKGGGWLNIRGADGRTYSYGHVDLAPELAQRWAAGERNIPVKASDTIASSGTANGVQHLHLETWAGDRQRTAMLDPGQTFGLMDQSGNPATSAVPTGGGSPGASPTAGSAGQGNPEQNAQAARMEAGSRWREFASGQTDAMLPYMREEAKMKIFNQWSDWDARRQIQYPSMSPTDAASAAVGNGPGGSELTAHKALDGAIKGAHSDAGVTHPGGQTQIAPQYGPKPTGEPLTPEEQAVNNQMNLANRMATTANRYMEKGAGTPYFMEGVKMQAEANKEVSELARNEAATSLLRKQGQMVGMVRGQFGFQSLINPNVFIPYGNYQHLPNQGQEQSTAPDAQHAVEQPQERTALPAPTQQGPSIGGVGAPSTSGSGPGFSPFPQGTFSTPPAPANQQSAAAKPLPASPALEVEQKQKQQQHNPAEERSGYSETDVLQHPAVNTKITPRSLPPISEKDIDPTWSTDPKAAADHFNKLNDEAQAVAQQSDAKLGRVISIQNTLAQLRQSEMGWGSGERAHAAEALNSLAEFSNAYAGTKFPKIKEAQVASYELAEKQLAGMSFDMISKTQGGAGRSRFAAKFLQESMANLNEAPQAVMGLISIMKQQLQRDVDYADGIVPWGQTRSSAVGYQQFFRENNPQELYDLRAVLEAKGAHASDVDYLVSHPEAAPSFDKMYGYGASALLMKRAHGRP